MSWNGKVRPVISTSSITVKSSLPDLVGPIRLGVVGPRDFRDYRLINDLLDFLCEHYDVRYIVSGGMRKDLLGVDTYAEIYADNNEFPKIIYPPQLKKFGSPLAYMRRNMQIAVTSDMVVAVWTGSRGTYDTMKKVDDLSKPVLVLEKRELKIWQRNTSEA